MKALLKAKSEITIGLKKEGTFIYDGDEPLLEPHVKKIKHAKCLSVGLKQDNALVCEVEHSENDGIAFY